MRLKKLQEKVKEQQEKVEQKVSKSFYIWYIIASLKESSHPLVFALYFQVK